MDPLFCLHDGSWVSLRNITTVIPRTHDDGATVLVGMAGGHTLRLFFETGTAAVQYAAGLAGEVNSLRGDAS